MNFWEQSLYSVLSGQLRLILQCSILTKCFKINYECNLFVEFEDLSTEKKKSEH